jgi:hypothetical protein
VPVINNISFYSFTEIFLISRMIIVPPRVSHPIPDFPEYVWEYDNGPDQFLSGQWIPFARDTIGEVIKDHTVIERIRDAAADAARLQLVSITEDLTL